MVLPSRDTCQRNTKAAGGWSWLNSEAKRCGHVGCYRSDINTCDFMHLILSLECILPSLVWCILAGWYRGPIASAIPAQLSGILRPIR